MKEIFNNYKNNRKNLTIDEIINVLLMSVIIVMPFIVTNIQEPM